jgi:hypothetical protein
MMHGGGKSDSAIVAKPWDNMITEGARPAGRLSGAVSPFSEEGAVSPNEDRRSAWHFVAGMIRRRGARGFRRGELVERSGTLRSQGMEVRTTDRSGRGSLRSLPCQRRHQVILRRTAVGTAIYEDRRIAQHQAEAARCAACGLPDTAGRRRGWKPAVAFPRDACSNRCRTPEAGPRVEAEIGHRAGQAPSSPSSSGNRAMWRASSFVSTLACRA